MPPGLQTEVVIKEGERRGNLKGLKTLSKESRLSAKKGVLPRGFLGTARRGHELFHQRRGKTM